VWDRKLKGVVEIPERNTNFEAVAMQRWILMIAGCLDSRSVGLDKPQTTEIPPKVGNY